MARNPLFALAVVAMVSSSPVSMSQPQPSPPLISKILRPLLTETDAIARTPKSRALFASTIYDFCAGALSKVPRLSPREDSWLRSELSSPRYASAATSVEYSQQYLVNLLERCAAHGSNIRPGNLQQKEEAIEWLGLASVFLDLDIEHHAEKISNQKRVVIDEFKDARTTAFVMIGQWIISHFAIPILKAN